MNETQFEIGDCVVKNVGDYTFNGIVVSAFRKLHSSSVRYVVENPEGILHIFSDKQLERFVGEQ